MGNRILSFISIKYLLQLDNFSCRFTLSPSKLKDGFLIASAVAGLFQKLVNKTVNSLESPASDPVIKQEENDPAGVSPVHLWCHCRGSEAGGNGVSKNDFILVS